MRATGNRHDWRERPDQHNRHVLPAVTAKIAEDRCRQHRQALKRFRRNQDIRARRLERLASLMQVNVARTLPGMTRPR